ncbi:hypothetical protein Sango_2767800 [Sesamum angolense]|uniref:Uncharacterized protein n=1 Tax=Sesamum angolense TaxID=2727404 RepID=A0AAE1W0Y9_9LAMI|nr:hypothetical protein Sango_2767800 [Sesamum angolense]
MLFVKPTPVLSNSNCSRWRWFEGCLGALDETYIEVRVPADEKTCYRTHKGFILVNVFGVCGEDLNFIYVLSGWDGSAADSRVLRDAMNRDNSLKIPRENVSSSDGDNVEYLDSIDANLAWTTWHLFAHAEQPRLDLAPLFDTATRLKRHWLANKALMASGLAILDWSAHMVTGNVDVFDSSFKVDPFARTLRHMSFLYYPSWSDVFGKGHANGVVSVTIEDSPGPIRLGHVPVTPECYVPSPNLNIYGEDHEFMATFSNEKPNNSND